jgi:EAL domain-containing protein (putative c-di-GMP-specific phosphodiesterase class I)
MPLTELIRYFNTADRATDSMLYPAGERVEAGHAGLRLGSLFQPIVDLQSERIVGHQAMLAAQRDDGVPVGSEAAYALCDSGQAVVHFDRLRRTLHALNFLAQRRHTGGYLQLTVHPRHLQAVHNQHGLVYEAILKRCGLAPADIVLAIDARGVADDTHCAHALGSYRQRGYRLAVSLSPDDAAATSAVFALRPEILRLSARHTGLESAARSANMQIELAGIASGTEFRAARADGIELAQGSLFGNPAADCRPTHSESRNPYNSLSPDGVHS